MRNSRLEAKPNWQAVPLEIRREAEAILGAHVERARRAWGGYAPSVTFRLALGGGRRALFKGVDRSCNEHMHWALGREEQVYRGLTEVIAPWAPALYASFRRDDWHVLLLEDLGRKSVPPWSISRARDAARGLADFHLSTLGRSLPDWLSRREHHLFERGWGRLAAESDGLRLLSGLAGEQAGSALEWLQATLPALHAAAERVARIPEPFALLHLDVRSDNLRLADGLLRLFDWPFAAVGPAEMDLAYFADTVACDGGPDPERIATWYAERLPPRPGALDASVAALAGSMAYGAWRPENPYLPRLRSFQRQQVRVSLAWAARRLGLPTPAWLGGLAGTEAKASQLPL